MKEEIYVSIKTGKIYLPTETGIDIQNPVERDLSKYKKVSENNSFKIYQAKKVNP